MRASDFIAVAKGNGGEQGLVRPKRGMHILRKSRSTHWRRERTRREEKIQQIRGKIICIVPVSSASSRKLTRRACSGCIGRAESRESGACGGECRGLVASRPPTTARCDTTGTCDKPVPVGQGCSSMSKSSSLVYVGEALPASRASQMPGLANWKVDTSRRNGVVVVITVIVDRVGWNIPFSPPMSTKNARVLRKQ